LQTHQARAERILAEAQSKHNLNLGTLFDAVGQITDDPSDEGCAEILARALGCLELRALLYLVYEARDQVDRCTRSRVHAIEARVQALRQAHGEQAVHDAEKMTVEAAGEPAKYRSAGIIHLAVVVHALVWAVEVPPDDLGPIISY